MRYRRRSLVNVYTWSLKINKPLLVNYWLSFKAVLLIFQTNKVWSMVHVKHETTRPEVNCILVLGREW